MPKNKLSEKYLENVKIFRGPTHTIPHLLQFAPKPKFFTPLAADMEEYIKSLNPEDVEILDESEEGQTESNYEISVELMGKKFGKKKEEDVGVNDTLETEDKLEGEKEKKVVFTLS